MCRYTISKKTVAVPGIRVHRQRQIPVIREEFGASRRGINAGPLSLVGRSGHRRLPRLFHLLQLALNSQNRECPTVTGRTYVWKAGARGRCRRGPGTPGLDCHAIADGQKNSEILFDFLQRVRHSTVRTNSLHRRSMPRWGLSSGTATPIPSSARSAPLDSSPRHAPGLRR